MSENLLEYDVALSFAGEDRKHAECLADGLRELAVRVFYDHYESATLWGEDLYERLRHVYRHKARYCVIFVSTHYAKKLWPSYELEQAIARALEESTQYILPLRLDDVEVPGLEPGVGYVDLRNTNISDVIKIVLEKLSGVASVHITHSESVSAGLRQHPTISRPIPPKLERAIDDVLTPDFDLDVQRFSELEAKLWDDGDPYHHYASLILAYALWKAGPQACAEHRAKLRNVRRLANGFLPESMAARWILGRADLTLASVEKSPFQKIWLTQHSYDVFKTIEATNLQIAIPLPGASQEFPEETLQIWDPEFDSLVDRVIVPHRYIEAAAISLAGLNGFSDPSLFDQALEHCAQAANERASNSGPRLNSDLLGLVAESLSFHKTHEGRGRVGKLGNSVERLKVKIENAGAKRVVPAVKMREWLANCDACLALITRNGHEHEIALDGMVAHLRQMVRLYGRTPDFISIDPIYRVAFEQDGDRKFSGLLEEVSRK